MSDVETPNSSSAAADNKAKLTEREMEILKKAWGCLKAAPEVDYPRLADALGMSNVRSASNAWSAIKKKLFADLPAPSPKEPKTPRSGKRKSPAKPKYDDDNDDDDGEADVASPSKKPRTPLPRSKRAVPKKGKGVKKEEPEVKEEKAVKSEGSDEAMEDGSNHPGEA